MAQLHGDTMTSERSSTPYPISKHDQLHLSVVKGMWSFSSQSLLSARFLPCINTCLVSGWPRPLLVKLKTTLGPPAGTVKQQEQGPFSKVSFSLSSFHSTLHLQRISPPLSLRESTYPPTYHPSTHLEFLLRNIPYHRNKVGPDSTDFCLFIFQLWGKICSVIFLNSSTSHTSL